MRAYGAKLNKGRHRLCCRALDRPKTRAAQLRAALAGQDFLGDSTQGVGQELAGEPDLGLSSDAEDDEDTP